MNIRQTLAAFSFIAAIAGYADPAHAAGKSAGLHCSNAANNIQFGIGSDALDDLLACVGGTWHSMIYGGPSGAIQAFRG